MYAITVRRLPVQNVEVSNRASNVHAKVVLNATLWNIVALVHIVTAAIAEVLNAVFKPKRGRKVLGRT